MGKAAPIFALISGTIALLGLLGAYFGILAPLTGFYGFALGALVGGSITVLVSLVAVFLARGGRDPDGMRLAVAGLAVGVGLVLIVLAAAAPGGGLPPINDITTDLESPPEFAPSSIVLDYVGRNMSYPPEFVEQVRQAYPDLQSIRFDTPPQELYQKALATAVDLGWEITARSDERLVFDAKEETSLFRFVDDITVRVVGESPGSKLDIRSKSRDGRGDLGANAARIRRFAEALQ
jgi:uncharacterized protein (DUF1499 family)